MARTRGTRIGSGAGWGGPAKGSEPRREKKPDFAPGNSASVGPRDMQTGPAIRAELLAMYVSIARNEDEPSPNRMAAGAHWLNRYEGTPVARNINVSVDDLADLDDTALAAERARLERALNEDREGGTPPPAEA